MAKGLKSESGAESASRTKPGRTARPKFRRRAKARPDEVLDAALDLFMEKGFAATRVEDVAQRAGISKGTIYLYFPSKEALMEGLIHRALSPIALKAVNTIEMLNVDPRTILKALGGMVGKQLSDPRVVAIPKLVIRESANFPELAAMYRREVIDKAMPSLIKLIERQVRSGRFRPVDPELAVRSMIGPIAIHLLLDEVFGIVPEGGLQMDKFIANHIDILFNGLSATPEQEHE